MGEIIREKIRKGAEDLFKRYGVRSISMDDIARHLSVSKKTLYQHFADKEEIVRAACRNYLDQNEAEFKAIQKQARNALEELVMLSGSLKRNVEDLNPSLLFDLQKYHPTAWQEWLNYKNNTVRNAIVRNLKQGMAEGFFREELDPEIIATMRLELVQLAFNEEVFPRERFRLTDVHVQIFDHFVIGLLTDKGKKAYLKCKQGNNMETLKISEK